MTRKSQKSVEFSDEIIVVDSDTLDKSAAIKVKTSEERQKELEEAQQAFLHEIDSMEFTESQ